MKNRGALALTVPARRGAQHAIAGGPPLERRGRGRLSFGFFL
jgi:hypothetical protein